MPEYIRVKHDKRTEPRQQSPRRDIARKLKHSGKTYKEIGEIMGISYQRAQQLVYPTKKERRMKMIKGAIKELGIQHA